MPVVTIEWYAGRSPEQKKEVAEKVTAAISEAGGASPEHVWIKFIDLPKSDWAIGGRIQE